MSGIPRSDITAGIRVLIVLKKDQRSGKLTEGIVKDILTKSPTHPHGIKVRLASREVGRVKKIVTIQLHPIFGVFAYLNDQGCSHSWAMYSQTCLSKSEAHLNSYSPVVMRDSYLC